MRKTYPGGVAALDGVDLHVAPGEIYGVVGRSGAGKSTLLRAVNLLERPDSGTVRVAGQELTALGSAELRAARRRIGMIFQQFHLLSARTVAGNVALPLELAGVARSQRGGRVRELLDLVGLSDKAGEHPARLSGGQRQRVAIARALATDPAVLLCDEATSALDPYTTVEILHLLRDLNRRLGLTILLITHDLGVVERICDRAGVLDAGRLVESGPVGGLLGEPGSALSALAQAVR
ncbi:methionine ABC transporter ATP-binding protein [Catellatospora paridis]|uniref:methionine ABC transporter ATP-binding protein n=1 Tax=Catellatospora paridis TaxID=1617086 RepID=UPI002E7B0ADB|nr:methionine ABC transporter ATP-binding protein [Catellatospora paridis]